MTEMPTTAPAPSVYTKDEAVELAIELLESSGWTIGTTGAAHALNVLKMHAESHRLVNRLKEQQARLDAERLDAEALALLNAATGENFTAFPTTPNVADFWRAAARKAREIHG